jgi:hypothetical protein
MPAEMPLERLQRWMLEVITQPGSASDALHSEAARREVPPTRLDEIILPSRTLDSEKRLAIYHRMYSLRMVEALEFDYPGVAHFLGHADFHAIVDGYVQVHPSRNYTLNRLGDSLPDYIASLNRLPFRSFIHDMARFELAITQVFDEAHCAALGAERIAAIPHDSWPGVRLRPVPAMRLLGLDYPVDEYLDAMKRGEPPPAIRKSPRWMIVYRKDFGVKQASVERRAWELLRVIVEGESLENAIDHVARRLRPRLAETEIFSWFRSWTAWGLFSGIET